MDEPESSAPKPPWDDHFLRALGYLVVQANYFEDALIDLYWAVSGKVLGAVLEDVRGKTLGALCKLTIAASERRFPDGPWRARLESLKPEMEKAITTRNEFVHASWAFDHQNELMHRTRIPRQAGATYETLMLKIPDVGAAIDLIGGVAERVWEDLCDSVEQAAHEARSVESPAK